MQQIIKALPVVLVDVMNLAFRSHFAFPRLMYDGQSTGVYFGFLNSLLRLTHEFGNRLVFCWDNGLPDDRRLPNWRKKIFPDYKVDRKPTADTAIIYDQLPGLLYVLRTLGYPSVGIAGLEADDLCGILCGEGVGIYTTDRDVYQLLDGEAVKVIAPVRGALHLIDAHEVERTYGVAIDRWAAYLALGGDVSDNIHVLQGVGPKIATKMVRAGARPDLVWNSNPSHFTRTYPYLVEHWERVRAAYEVALIPRTLHDPRIRAYTKGVAGFPNFATDMCSVYWRYLDREQRFAEFTRFCAEHGLLRFMARRAEFFK